MATNGRSSTNGGRLMMASAIMALALVLTPGQARAQQINCSTEDSDGDGFTNAQECTGISLLNGTRFPGALEADGKLSTLPRANRLDPGSKDLFVVLAPVAVGSLLSGDVPTGIADPFGRNTFYGITFNGFSSVSVTAHMLPSSALDGKTRRFTQDSTQKAVVIYEVLDDTDLNTLAYCPYGRPTGPDENVCVLFTRRILIAIQQICGSALIVTPSGAASNAVEVFKAYAMELILHEFGHSMGGLTPKWNSRYGGYHYASGTIMEQYVVASKNADKCTFGISSSFNTKLDPPAVILK